MKHINKKLAVTAVTSLLLSLSVASQADAAMFVSIGAVAPMPMYAAPMVAAPVAYAPPVAYAAPMVAPAPVMVAPYPAAYYYGYGPHHYYWHQHRDGRHWH